MRVEFKAYRLLQQQQQNSGLKSPLKGNTDHEGHLPILITQLQIVSPGIRMGP